MKILKWLVLALLAMSWVSCVASLLPLFEDRYLVEEPGVLGAWKAEESGDTWTFERADGKECLLIYRQAEYDLAHSLGSGTPPNKVPGDTVRFRARLGRLGGGLFLDLFPSDEGNPEIRNDLFNFHLIPAHTLARVWLEKDSLRIGFLDEDWLSKAIEDGRIRIAHVKTENWLILTAPTDEIQDFILKHADDAKAFPLGDVESLRRVKLP